MLWNQNLLPYLYHRFRINFLSGKVRVRRLVRLFIYYRSTVTLDTWPWSVESVGAVGLDDLIFSLLNTDACVLRERYRIVGALIGCLPRFPRQNIHLGLPLQLMPEEATLLFETGLTLFSFTDYFLHWPCCQILTGLLLMRAVLFYFRCSQACSWTAITSSSLTWRSWGISEEKEKIIWWTGRVIYSIKIVKCPM